MTVHDENRRLREALREALEMVGFWSTYADEHYRKKWNLAGDLTTLRDALGEEESDDRTDSVTTSDS